MSTPASPKALNVVRAPLERKFPICDVNHGCGIYIVCLANFHWILRTVVLGSAPEAKSLKTRSMAPDLGGVLQSNR